MFAEVGEAVLGPLRLSVPVWASLDPRAALLAAAAMLAMFRFHLGILPTLAMGAIAGVVIRMVA